jgi:hypothetical protein
MALVMILYLLITSRRRWLFEIPVFAGVLAAIVWNSDPNAIWSPYYFVTIVRNDVPGVTQSAPPADLLTMRDPPIYSVNVNQFGYHLDASLDPARYTPGTKAAAGILWLQLQYGIPYAVADGRDRILVVGAGGGCDVEAALAAGSRHVDAVEVDPAVVAISRRFNAGAPYSDPRVSVHVDDARSFLARAKPGYDLVVFGFLDSQALFSTMNNVRLDGYVYTVEGIRSAYRLLNASGTLSLSFGLGKAWMGPKLYEMVVQATGREPFLYYDADGPQLILIVPKDARVVLPSRIFRFTRISYGRPPIIDLATDDWPFLYLTRKTIPSDYLVAIASLMAFCIAGVAWLRRGSFGANDTHFGLLGMGFMLLETKSISDCSLFFGATWFVTMVVVAGVLIMVIAANLVAERLKGFSFWMYAPLFAVLALLLMVPREHIVEYDFAGRLLWTLVVVPLPIFFAGIIFSTTFRSMSRPRHSAQTWWARCSADSASTLPWRSAAAGCRCSSLPPTWGACSSWSPSGARAEPADRRLRRTSRRSRSPPRQEPCTPPCSLPGQRGCRARAGAAARGSRGARRAGPWTRAARQSGSACEATPCACSDLYS